MSKVLREMILWTDGGSSIIADVDAAQAILKKMGAKAQDIRQQKKLLENLSSSTETCWKGLSGDALREHLARLIKEQEAIAKDLEQDTKMMIDTLQQLENEDKELATAIRGSGSKGSGNALDKAKRWFDT